MSTPYEISRFKDASRADGNPTGLRADLPPTDLAELIAFRQAEEMLRAEGRKGAQIDAALVQAYQPQPSIFATRSDVAIFLAVCLVAAAISIWTMVQLWNLLIGYLFA